MAKVRSGLRVEALEGRDVPAATGFPWGNAGHLTLSFAPDGTDVGGQISSLSTTFANSADYQREVLRAFQTWAVNGNINVAVQADSGDPLGTPGARQGDARFGDVRITAAPVQDADLAIAAPHDPFLAGTWSGDVVFDSGTAFGGATGTDVFTVALHEAGHALGLDHTTDPHSAMLPQLAGPRTGLAAADVKALRALYGTRAGDRFDGGMGNGALALADGLNAIAGTAYDGTTPIALYADITSLRDRDTFAIRPAFGYTGPMTFRVQTAGVSLLAPRVTVYDQAGKPIQTATATDPAGSVVKLTLDAVVPGRKYYVRVESGTRDVFGIGTYALAVTYDGLNTVPEATIDQVLRGPYRTLTPADLQALFLQPDGLIHDDHGSDDNSSTASRLSTTPGYPAATHYEVLASISAPGGGGTTGGGETGGHGGSGGGGGGGGSGGGGGETGGGGSGGHGADDFDNYRLRTPTWTRRQTGVLTATVWTLSGATAPAVQVLDRDGNLVPTDVLANGNGTYTVQAVGVAAGRDYYIELGGATPGNYSLAVDLTTRPAVVSTFATGTLTAAQPNAARALYLAQSQVFDFLLSAPATDPVGSSVRLSVINAAGVTVFSLTAGAGATVSGPAVFLPAGDYALVFEGLAGATGYTLRGAGLTTPVGPTPTDPSGKPIFTAPDAPPGEYVYPGDLIGYDPNLANLLQTTYGIPTQPTGSTSPVVMTSPYAILMPVQ